MQPVQGSRQDRNLLLSREENIKVVGSIDAECCFKPTEWVISIGRNSMHPLDMAGEASQCHRIRTQNFNHMA